MALAPALRAEFGAYKYAQTSGESTRPDVLRTLDVEQYLRRSEGKRGEVYATQKIDFLSVVFSWAPRVGLCNYNPYLGAERNQRNDDAGGDATAAAGHAYEPIKVTPRR